MQHEGRVPTIGAGGKGPAKHLVQGGIGTEIAGNAGDLIHGREPGVCVPGPGAIVIELPEGALEN